MLIGGACELVLTCSSHGVVIVQRLVLSLKLVDCALKLLDCALKLLDCALKLQDCGLASLRRLVTAPWTLEEAAPHNPLWAHSSKGDER